jgi:hypothetical protein
MPDDDELLTSKEIAAWLKVSECWVRDHALGRRQPRLPSIRLGGERGLLRFRRRDILHFLSVYQRGEVA